MLEGKYYVDLAEFPLFNWEKCHDGNLIFMRTNVEDIECVEFEDAKHWELLQFDYMDKFGVGRDLAKITNLKREILVNRLELMVTGDNFIKNTIDDLQEELNRLIKVKSDVGVSIDKNLLYMNKNFNCGLDKRKIMTYQYFLMAEEYGKKNK